MFPQKICSLIKKELQKHQVYQPQILFQLFVLGIYWFQIYVHISKKYGLLLLMEDDQMMFSIFALQ